MLTRIVLARRYGCEPEIRTLAPDLAGMLEDADAALIIGDPALRIDPSSVPYRVLDLGQEWWEMTGLPMVFALWSGAQKFMTEENRAAFSGSCRFGLDHIEEIVKAGTSERNIPADLIRTYLTNHIVFQLGPEDLRGLERFWEYSAEVG
jgi:predicted solute-binding protein